MKTLAALVFPGFQTLDYFGPVEMLGGMRDDITVITVAQSRDPVPSVHGQRIVPDATLADRSDYDLILVPGGDAALDQDAALLQWLRDASATAERVMAVCTGSVLLGMAGVLDGRRATTNKLDFIATVPRAPDVNWVREARWVEDGKFFTSSGVSAGMDMALAALESLYGKAAAEEMAEGCEYEWHRDASRDPFAQRAGLI